MSQGEEQVTYFLVKWKVSRNEVSYPSYPVDEHAQNQSYLHLDWVSEAELLLDKFGKARITKYYQNPPLLYNQIDENKPFNPDYEQVAHQRIGYS